MTIKTPADLAAQLAFKGDFSAEDPDITEYKEVGVNGVNVVDEDQGIIECIVSVTGMKDNVNDNIKPGAYTETLKKRVPKGVWGHDWNQPVPKTLEIKELMPGDPNLPSKLNNGQPWPAQAGALWVKTKFNLNTQRGRDAYEDVKFSGTDSQWSIGYRVPKGAATMDQKSQTRNINALELYEYSPVLWGAMSHAQTLSVKSAQIAHHKINLNDNEFKAWMDNMNLELKDAGLTDDEPVVETETVEGTPEAPTATEHSDAIPLTVDTETLDKPTTEKSVPTQGLSVKAQPITLDESVALDVVLDAKVLLSLTKLYTSLQDILVKTGVIQTEEPDPLDVIPDEMWKTLGPKIEAFNAKVAAGEDYESEGEAILDYVENVKTDSNVSDEIKTAMDVLLNDLDAYFPEDPEDDILVETEEDPEEIPVEQLVTDFADTTEPTKSLKTVTIDTELLEILKKELS